MLSKDSLYCDTKFLNKIQKNNYYEKNILKYLQLIL